MAYEHRHAHAGRGELDLGIENLLGLDHHLPFLLGRAVFHEDVDMRNDVEGDLLGEDLWLGRIGDEDALGLVPQLVHRFLARAGHRLIGGDDHALDLGEIVQRLQHHDELRGRAIRVGDDVLLGEARHGVGVHFRHDERNVGVVAPAGGIVDDDAALRADPWAPLLGDGRARRHQGEVDAAEVEILEVAAFEALIAEGHLDAHRPARGDGEHLVGGKLPLGEDIEHLPADIAGGSDDGDFITHDLLLHPFAGDVWEGWRNVKPAQDPLQEIIPTMRNGFGRPFRSAEIGGRPDADAESGRAETEHGAILEHNPSYHQARSATDGKIGAGAAHAIAHGHHRTCR